MNNEETFEYVKNIIKNTSLWIFNDSFGKGDFKTISTIVSELIGEHYEPIEELTIIYKKNQGSNFLYLINDCTELSYQIITKTGYTVDYNIDIKKWYRKRVLKYL